MNFFSADGCKYVVKIDGKEYGSGEGLNRTIAKNIAALETLKLLIPDFEPDDKFMLTGRAEQDYAYFNHLSVIFSRQHNCLLFIIYQDHRQSSSSTLRASRDPRAVPISKGRYSQNSWPRRCRGESQF